MTDAKSSDVYKAVSASQERFAFFILAASGSAIAFALIRTERGPIALWMCPVALAIVLWGISFWSGANHILTRHEIFFMNLQLLKVEEGSDPVTGTDPARQKVIGELITEQAGRKNGLFRLWCGSIHWPLLMPAG